MFRGYDKIDQGKLSAVNALHGETALRLLEARDRLESKSASAAFAFPARREHLAALDNMLAAMPMRNPDTKSCLSNEEEAALESAAAAEIEKVLGVMAVMINEAGADIAAMSDLISTIGSMDRAFFMCGGEEETAPEVLREALADIEDIEDEDNEDDYDDCYLEKFI